jgi:putative hydrolase of the HAD superfamily
LDLDDTLLPWNTSSHWQWAWRPQGPKLGERHVRSAIRRALRGWDRRRWRGLVGAEPPVDLPLRRAYLLETLHAIAGRRLPEAEATAVVDRFDRPAGEIENYDDVGPTLRRLGSDSIPVGIATELPEAAARWALRRTGLSAVALVAHGDDPPEDRLPTRTGFRAACEKLGVSPSETIFVGDLFWSDVRAAARAGLTAILLDRYDRFSGVEARRIASLHELPALRPGPDPSEPAEPAEGPVAGP